MKESEKREAIEIMFHDMRLGKQDRGLGDIHLSISKQNELGDALLAVMARFCTLEYIAGLEAGADSMQPKIARHRITRYLLPYPSAFLFDLVLN